MKSRKICFVSHGLAGGGMERALVSLANHYALNKHDITILNLYRTEVFYDIHPGIRVIWPDFNSRNRYLYILKLILFLRKNIKRLSPDVVLSFGETFNSYTLIATRLLNIRVVLTNRMWPSLKLGFPAGFLNKLLYRFADGVVAQTNTAKLLIEKHSYNSNIVVIPNAVLPIETRPVIKKKQLISVGRLSKAKGHTVLLNAFAKLPTNDWTLHFVGSGPEYKKLLNEADLLEVSEKTIFHGHLKDFSQLLAESEIFVLPSLHEGFPNALVEAMSVPLACISSDCVAGPSEIIKDGVNGLLFETGNVEQLSMKLSLLMKDAAMRENLAKEAFKVRQEFAFDKIADLYYNFIMNEQNISK